MIQSEGLAMTGWGVLPASLAERVHLLMVHSIGCTALFTQVAGVAALTGNNEHIRTIISYEVVCH